MRCDLRLAIAESNPCPCGHLGDPRHECRCTPQQIERYCRFLQERVSVLIAGPGEVARA